MLAPAPLPTARFHVLLSTVVVLVAAMLLTSQTATAGKRASPLDYRYAGVVETGAGVPAHTITTGRGLFFSFYDSFSQGRKEERRKAAAAGHLLRPYREPGRPATGLRPLCLPPMSPTSARP